MPKIYPDYETPTMIYNADNQYTIVDAVDVPAFVAAGWSETPVSKGESAEFLGDVTLPTGAPEPKTKKKSKPASEE